MTGIPPLQGAKEKDALLPRRRIVNGNPPVEFDPEVKRVRRMAFVALFVAIFLALGFFTALLLRPPHQVEGDSRPGKHKKKYHKHKKDKFRKNNYNDLASYLEESNENQLEIDDTGAVAKSHLSCTDGGYSKRTLKRALEVPLAGLFQDNRGQNKFEASDVIIVNNTLYIVCDSSWSVSEVAELRGFSSRNRHIGDPNRVADDESGYEVLMYDDDSFFVIRESVLHHNIRQGEHRGSPSYHAIVEELTFLPDKSDYQLVRECRCEFEFEGDSKGYEGGVMIRDLDNIPTILGLCEGNHCSETKKNDRGNGMVIVMQKATVDNGSCVWKTIRKVLLPADVLFADYSSFALDSHGRVAVTSQEDSRLYVGSLLGQEKSTGLWDIDSLSFDPEDVTIYDFPKNDDCATVYCNIEGIHWLQENMLVAVSDKMKSKGKQDFRCFDKDQSVHAFVLP